VWPFSEKVSSQLNKQMNDNSVDLPEIHIEAKSSWGLIDFRELLDYRDLLFFMVVRTVKVSYAQSVAGLAWAVIQPALQVLVFSLVFGILLGVDSDGLPYPLITTVAVIPWTYMSASLNGASNSLVNNAGMLGKIYFPRVIFLLNPVIGNLIPFVISLFLLAAVLLYYQVALTLRVLMLPAIILLMVLTPLAFGFWISSLAIRFRDIKIAMSHFIRMLIYIVPVMYPPDRVPSEWRSIYILNPFVGIIEGFRSCLLPEEQFRWDSLLISAVVTVVLLFTGMIYFRRMERVIVDVI
jgi:lipopolysaccharide transport system permease protein